jgi:nucleotide-binding universal stress UspA family protein
MKRIVLGVDGSDGSIQAARVAGRLTADLGAELTAVHDRVGQRHLEVAWATPSS